MASTRRAPGSERRAGLWSTVTAAIQGGWGQTARLVIILVVLGGVLAVPAVAADYDGLLSMLRTVIVIGR